MSPALTFVRVILPQALLAMLPPFGNLLIELLKATSLVSLITLTDLTFVGSTMIASTGRAGQVWGVVLLLYLAMASPMKCDFHFALEILPLLLRGAVVTVEATFGGMALALVIGLLLAVGR